MTSPPPLAPLATLRWSLVRSMIDQLAPPRVLEIGCGQGGFGARLAATTSYVGVERDEQSCDIARRHITAAGGRLVQGTVDALDPADRFDLVCAFEVLEHIDDDRSALADWVGRVAPGGSVIVSVPAWPDRYGAWDERVGHYRRYLPGQLDDLLTGVGCTSVRHVLYGWPLGYVTETIRNRLAARRDASGNTSMADRTARSGRSLQPSGVVTGLLSRAGAAPFVEMQRHRPTSGIGLIGVGRCDRES